MINNDRIVPVTKIDYLSLVGTILKLHGTSYSVLPASDTEGNFTLSGSGAAGNALANQPAKSLNFGSGVTSGTIYFVAAYDFRGIFVNGSAATIDDAGLDLADVKPDGVTLYTAALSGGEVTISAVTPELS